MMCNNFNCKSSMKVKNLFLVGAAALSAFLLTSCCGKNGSCNNSGSCNNNTTAETNKVAESTQAAAAVAPQGGQVVVADGMAPLAATVEGTFEGTLPGADNGGCTYTVDFAADGSCSVTRTYKKDGVAPSTVKGTFSVAADQTMVTCTLKGDEPIYFVRLSNNDLLMVDANGTIPERVDDYKLTRK